MHSCRFCRVTLDEHPAKAPKTPARYCKDSCSIPCPERLVDVELRREAVSKVRFSHWKNKASGHREKDELRVQSWAVDRIPKVDGGLPNAIAVENDEEVHAY